MITCFQSAVDSLFVRLGVKATYIDSKNNKITVTAIIKSPDRIIDFREAHIHTPTHIIELRVSEITKPQAGDIIIIADNRYTVQAEPEKDQHNLIWRLNVVQS